MMVPCPSQLEKLDWRTKNVKIERNQNAKIKCAKIIFYKASICENYMRYQQLPPTLKGAVVNTIMLIANDSLESM